MKAILEFDLPEDNSEFRNAVNANGMFSVLWDLDQHLRSKIKHGDLPSGEYRAYEDVREYLRDAMLSCGVTFDES